MITAVTLALTLFVSTNIDDIFVLLGFFADPKFHFRDIFFGQFFGLGALLAISFAGSLVALIVPKQSVGLLGLLPIILGVNGLLKLFSLDKGEEQPKAAFVGGRMIAVALVTIANGGDNIGAYTPVFATKSFKEILTISLVFALLTLLWVALAHQLVKHPTLGAPIRRLGHVIGPMVLIVIGICVFIDAGSASLFV